MFEIRKDRAPQGRKKLARERAAYFDLVAQGYSSKQACRIVGVNHRTGKRGRNGTRPTAGSRYLSQEERIWIADRRREKARIRTIARELGRDPATISREVRRKQHPTSGDYRPYAAHDRAVARRPRPKQMKIAGSRRLRQVIQTWLDCRCSPEQIAARLRRDFPDDPTMRASHETIYRALYVRAKGGLRREVAATLRTGPC